MFRAWRQNREIFSKENTFLLTKRSLFQNTTLVAGSNFSAPDSRGVRRFHGYTFRADDSQSVSDTFSNGFLPQPTLSEPVDGSPFSSTNVISYVCYYAAHCVSQRLSIDNIYLIDIGDIGGMVRVPAWNQDSSTRHAYKENDLAFVFFPITKKAYRVETPNPVSGVKVVGVVEAPDDPFRVRKLKLYANKNYTEGILGVSQVVDLFNGNEWELVDASDATSPATSSGTVT